MASENAERLKAELELMQAMYPEQITFDDNANVLSYISDSARLDIRLPSAYPSAYRPDIINASTKGTHHVDLRSQMKQAAGSLPEGEECLDSLISAFVDLVDRQQQTPVNTTTIEDPNATGQKKTVLIWLHHLLNTNKRKQALAADIPSVSGISKPGYPGVLIFSGPQANVDEHVQGLKGLNWAAFQVRLEDDEEWLFEHGHGVKEVESMGDVVKEIGEHKKATFLEAMKMK